MGCELVGLVCTALARPRGMFELPWTAVEMSPTELIRPGCAEDGLTEAMYVDRARITSVVLEAWAKSVQLREEFAGILVEASNPLGHELLAALQIPTGSWILAINGLLTKGNATTGEPGAGLWEAIHEVARVVDTGGIVALIIAGADGKRYHRYIIASPGASVRG